MASCSEVCGTEHSEHAQGVVDADCHGFGVRSYLHHFYEECTASVWDHQEDRQAQRSHQPWSSGLWKICLVCGALILAMGLVMLSVGCLVPSRIETFGEGELLFVDHQAVRFNQGLHLSMLAGTGMLSLGGLLMAGGFLLSAFFSPTKGEEPLYPQPRGRERKVGPGRAGVGSPGGTKADPITKPPTPVSVVGAVPVTLITVENIQPTL